MFQRWPKGSSTWPCRSPPEHVSEGLTSLGAGDERLSEQRFGVLTDDPTDHIAPRDSFVNGTPQSSITRYWHSEHPPMCYGDMALQRMDNVLIVVDDLEAAKAFFAELGMELEGETQVEGDWVDRVVGLNDVRLLVDAIACPKLTPP